MRLKKARTITADLYSIGVIVSPGRKIIEIEHEASLELLANYKGGIIPEIAARDEGLEGRARIAKVRYSLPNGDETVSLDFEQHVYAGRPKTIRIRDTREIIIKNHRR